MFQPIKPRRISDEIVEQIKDLIAKGSLKPGDRLPSERQMTQHLGVSRPTLREAIQVLENLGLLKSVMGNGTYVQNVAERSLKDPLNSLIQDSGPRFGELAEFRTAIESWAAGLAAERIEPRDETFLREILDEMEDGLRTGGAIHQLDADFHLAIGRAAHNGIYFHVANTIFYLFAEVTRLSHERIFTSQADQKQLLEEHRGIFEAIQSGDASSARKLMHGHLQNTERWFKRTERVGVGRQKRRAG